MKCKLCDEKYDTRYRIPRNLFCGHCFCEQCLKIYLKEDEIECPKCSKKSQSKLPICYAIYEIIDNDDIKKFDYCTKHNNEIKQFYCSTCRKNVCAICLIQNHNSHTITIVKEKNIINQIRLDYDNLINFSVSKLKILNKYKAELDKCEEFLKNMRDNQISKLNEIQYSIVNRKKEKIELLNKVIDINHLNQMDTLSKYLSETEIKKSFIDIYIKKIDDLYDSFATQSATEIANFNIIRTEDEFKKVRLEIDNTKYSNEIRLNEIVFDFNPKKLISEEKINYDSHIELSSAICNKKQNINSIVFIGDSKDKIILKYSLDNNTWEGVNVKFICNYSFWDYTAVDTFSNGDILITGGCHYINYKTTAQKNTYLAKFMDNQLILSLFKPMITDRFSHGCVIVKDIPYVFGGHDGNECLSSMEYYDKEDNKWKFLSFMNVEREIFAYCTIKDRYIYVFGGFNNNHLDLIERYDIIYDKWKVMNIKLRRPLQNATAVNIDDKQILLIGGYSGTLHNNIELLDLEKKTWVNIINMKVPRRRPHSYRYKEKIYIFGGESSGIEKHTPEIFDYINNSLSELEPYDIIISRSLNFWSSVGLYI